MSVGFVTNFLIGVLAYTALNFLCPSMRHVDQATVAGYYASDSAGTFVTTLGVLGTAHISFAAYMHVMLATASRKLKDLKSGGPGFIAFALISPNSFATIGITVAHTYAYLTGVHFELGSHVLIAVLCAAASYIAFPAVQRLAIPEASATLPLGASLGLTFSYNVTIGIPVYDVIAQQVMRAFPVA
jgi:hypothetical protein